MKQQAIIFDIDGTLADCSHRRYYIEKPNNDWGAFYAGMAKDTPTYLATLLSTGVFNFALPIFVTGRPEEYRYTTEQWLLAYTRIRFPGNKPPILLMRPDGDYTPDDDLKRRIYIDQIKPHFDIQLVFDDRNKVVKMWRSLGLECWQVAEGNF